MAKPADSSPLTEHLRSLALTMAVACVRNTVIENYHADGKISDAEMKAFNKEVVNRLYTVLCVLHDPELKAGQPGVLRYLDMYYPTNWDQPRLDANLVGGVSPEIDDLIANGR